MDTQPVFKIMLTRKVGKPMQLVCNECDFNRVAKSRQSAKRFLRMFHVEHWHYAQFIACSQAFRNKPRDM